VQALGTAQAAQAPALVKSANAQQTCQEWTCGEALKHLELRAAWVKPSDDRCCSTEGNHAVQALGTAQAVQAPVPVNMASTKQTCQDWTCGEDLKHLELRAAWVNPSHDRCCSPEGNHAVQALGTAQAAQAPALVKSANAQQTCQEWTCGEALKHLELRAAWVKPSDDRCCSPAGNHAAVQAPVSMHVNPGNQGGTCGDWRCSANLALVPLRLTWQAPSDERCCQQSASADGICGDFACPTGLALLPLRATWIHPTADRCCQTGSDQEPNVLAQEESDSVSDTTEETDVREIISEESN